MIGSQGLGNRARFLSGVLLLAGLFRGPSSGGAYAADPRPIAATSSSTSTSTSVNGSGSQRARELGILFEGAPGRYNAITDVPDVEVGQTTIISGDGALHMGSGPVRTGVTAVLPRGKRSRARSVAAIVSLNGNGEMTGSHWVLESGFLESPILITNTASVGTVRDAVIAWGNRHFPPQELLDEAFALPVVAETYDGFLNDINGQHVRKEHVFAALDGAQSGPVAEGNVGGGTGMMTSEWKGGIGTSSRLVTASGVRYVVGVLVQANYGRRSDLRILGAPVGREIPQQMPLFHEAKAPGRQKDGSIIVVIGTNAPLLPHQMARLARRASLGLGRLGAVSYQSSGDIFIAFGRAEPPPDSQSLQTFTALSNEAVDPILQGVVQATEEAIVNALLAAKTMVGIDGNTVHAIPHDRLLEVLRKYHAVR